MLGQALVTAALARNWLVHTLGRKDGPITDAGFLAGRIASLKPDYLFNAIAYTAVDDAEDNPDEANALNRAFPALLGRIIRGTPVRLIHYSTDFVFDGKKTTPYEETDPVNPLNVYGSGKLAGEQALLPLPNCCIIRTAWLFGPGRKNFVSAILDRARVAPHLPVVHDQIGSPTYTGDLAQMSLLLAEAGASGIVHAVNGGQARWSELASEAVAQASLNTVVQPIPSSQWPQKARRPAYSVLDTGRFTSLTGCTPRPWYQALRDYIYGFLT
jgi:dTDP-4-dehydrorhamnose reductase